MIKQLKCKDCHWFKDNEPFEIMSNGKYYPCSNIGVFGWEYWNEKQEEPEDCDGYCKRGEYEPTGVWAGVAEVVKEVAKIAEPWEGVEDEI